MEFTLKLNMDNDAFTGDMVTELQRILSVVQNELPYSTSGGVLRDYNGGIVGSYNINR